MIPYRFHVDSTARSLHEVYDGLEAGAETGKTVSVGGRLMLTRPQGKLAFATLVDSTGAIQLFAGGWTNNLDEFSKLAVGTWVGVTGEVAKTRRGELSIKVADWVVLAEIEEGRSFGDKWHGVTDPDTRFRQRYVDLWANEGVRDVFVMRSRVVSLIRRWLEDRGYMEVETPLLHPIPGGAEARPFVTHHNALDVDLYLRIAPELYLKRLVVGGFEKVFEIGRVFRNEGLSTRHNPEFTLLELYEAYADYQQMAELTEELIAHVAMETRGTTRISYGGRELDLTPPWPRKTMTELVEEHAGVHVSVDMDVERLRQVATEHGVHVEEHWGSGKLVLEIFEKTTEHELWGPIFVMDYPKEVSPLARDHREVRGLVERFEPIVAGREIGNAFSELADPAEQRARFEDQVRARSAGDQEAMAFDADYVRALGYGLPPTGGLGIGIDRLVMLLADVHSIRDVIFFPTLRPEQE